jgi:membrane protein
MSVVSRLDGFQRRHRVIGFPIAVAYKFFDDQGGYLAALITYYAFVSLFPLLLIFTTVMGVVLEHRPALRDTIVQWTLEQIPIIGEQLHEPSGLTGGTVAVIVGLAGALYGGLGVAVASQNAMNIAWQVPRNSRPNPIRVRVRGFVLLLTVGVAMVGLIVINIASAWLPDDSLSGWFVALGTVLLGVGVFGFALKFGTARPVGWLDVLPGAVIAALGWQVLQHFGQLYAQRVVVRAQLISGVFATVLGLIAFLYLAAALVVVCLEINVVRTDVLYPRSLLTPFTDSVHLTPGDERAYTGMARAQRNKGFEVIDVAFHNPLDDEPADPGSAGPDRPQHGAPEVAEHRREGHRPRGERDPALDQSDARHDRQVIDLAEEP